MGIKIYTQQDIRVALSAIDSAASIVSSLGYEDECRRDICTHVRDLLRDVEAILGGPLAGAVR